MVVPICPVPVKLTATVLLASAVPLMAKVVSLVISSLLEEPVSVVMPDNVGAEGTLVSIITFNALEAELVFPDESVPWAVIL